MARPNNKFDTLMDNAIKELFLGCLGVCIFFFGSWILSQYPAYDVQINGKLVEAVVVDIATPGQTGTPQEYGVKATVTFVAECQTKHRATETSCPEVTATVQLPAEVAAETVKGDHIPITYLPEKSDYAVYGLIHNTMVDSYIVSSCLIIAALTAGMFWTARKRRKLKELGRPYSSLPFVICALISLLVAFLCIRQTTHQLIWEYGMAYDRRTSSSEIKELSIKDEHYIAKYAVVMEDGTGFWRERSFDASEVDDSQKMKVGRKFDVVYIGRNAAYNRPDWVEAIIAPKRPLWILLGIIIIIEAFWLAIRAIWLARGGSMIKTSTVRSFMISLLRLPWR